MKKRLARKKVKKIVYPYLLRYFFAEMWDHPVHSFGFDDPINEEVIMAAKAHYEQKMMKFLTSIGARKC